MRTLLLLRHAKSSWKDVTLSDHDRPLNGRGKRDAPKMGRLLRTEQLVPDLVICSTAKRARATTKLVVETSGYGEEVIFTPDLYHAASFTYLEVLRQVPDQYRRVLVVGHNPNLEYLLEELTGDWEHLPTATLAQVTLPIEHWRELDAGITGTLVNLWVPRALV